jgi:hypothetical protein
MPICFKCQILAGVLLGGGLVLLLRRYSTGWSPSSALVGNRQLNVSRVLRTLLLPNPKQLQSLEPKFRQAIQASRVNAVAIPEFESQRLLVVLKSIDPTWHRVWKPAV